MLPQSHTANHRQIATSPPGHRHAHAAAVAAAAGIRVPRADMLTRVCESVARVTSLGVVLSLILHVLVTSAAVVIGFGIGGGGSGDGQGNAGESIEYTLTSPAELVDVPAAMVQNQRVTTELDPAAELGSAGPLEGSGGFDEPASGAGLGAISDGLGGAGGGDIGTGEGLGGGGMGGGATFFGVEARGSRFVYICDVSGSMNEHAGGATYSRLSVLKNELARSLSDMLEHIGFCVLLFSSESKPLTGSVKWTSANTAGKKHATDRLAEVVAFGGTEPWPAFEIALNMKPAPDAIYFMTDGVFDPSVAFKIQAKNTAGKMIPIHCITLVEKSGEEIMRKIAADSGGTYKHVDGLGEKP